MIGRIRRLEKVLEHYVESGNSAVGPNHWIARPGWERVGESSVLVWVERGPERRARSRKSLNGKKSSLCLPRNNFGGAPHTEQALSPLFIRATCQRLRTLLEQDPDGLESAALYMDGNWLSEASMVFAIMIRLKSVRFWLGLVRSERNGEGLLGEFLRYLTKREMGAEPEILWLGADSGGRDDVLRSLLECLTGGEGSGARHTRSWWAVYPCDPTLPPGK